MGRRGDQAVSSVGDLASLQLNVTESLELDSAAGVYLGAIVTSVDVKVLGIVATGNLRASLSDLVGQSRRSVARSAGQTTAPCSIKCSCCCAGINQSIE